MSVVFVVGPTAAGKSALALELAQAYNGEIVNADSRQVYRHMDIGTSKPSPQDLAQMPHHLIDILDPDQEFNLAMFLALASQAIQNIQRRGRLPIVTGGTGQYIWALVEGWRVPHVPPNPTLRADLESRACREGPEAIHRQLAEVDPAAASKTHPHNLRRVIRALEVYHATGISPLTDHRRQRPPYDCLVVGLTMERQELYQAIDHRVGEMLENGLVEEVRGLLERGYGPDLPCMSSMGYKEIALHIRGEINLEEAARRIQNQTHRLARHQHAWFRPGDPRIHWLEAGPDTPGQAKTLVESFLSRGIGCDKMGSAREELLP